VIAGQIVLPQLDHRIGPPSRPRIGEAHRLHRTEPHRLDAPVRHDLDGQAALEELGVVEVPHRRLLGRDDGLLERVIFVRIEGAVQVVAGAC
jgi:hypothetical protein